MTKFLLGIITGFFLMVLTAVIVVFSIARMGVESISRFGGERRPTIPDNGTLMLDLRGEIPERQPIELALPFYQYDTPATMKDVWETLHKARVDSKIKAVVVRPSELQVGWAKLQEIRSCLEEFRKSGKPLVAYLKAPGAPEYYLASAADKIYLAPEDYLNLKGLRAEMMFFKNTFDKLGVQVQIEHAGKYKDFGDMLVREQMSPETREVLNSVLDELYGHLVSTIGSARKKSVQEMRSIIDEGPFLSEQAKAKGLVDSLEYEDQMMGQLKDRLKAGDIRKVAFHDYVKIDPASLGLKGGPKIALIIGEGGITRGDDSDGLMSEDGITSGGFNSILRKVSNDSSIKGVIVRIDSPGGDSAASDEIWREMNLLSKKKPLVISMSDAAASGGYYMAMTGDPILAYQGTFTGSIGVVFGKANLHGLYNKLGITKDSLSRGRFAEIDSDYRPLSEVERLKLREGIDSVYKTFVTRVADSRKKKYEQIEPLAQGRVWLGSQAKRNGLIDELGGFDRAIELVKERAKIGKDERVEIVSYPPKRTWLDLMLGDRTPEFAFDTKLRAMLRGLPRFEGWQVRLWSRGGLMRLMPFVIEVR